MINQLNLLSRKKYCPVTQREAAAKIDGQIQPRCQEHQCDRCQAQSICSEFGWWHCSACDGWHIGWTSPPAAEKQNIRFDLLTNAEFDKPTAEVSANPKNSLYIDMKLIRFKKI